MTDVTEPTQPPVASGATERAASAASSAKDQAASVASTAAGEAKAVASEAAAEAKNLMSDARQQLRSQAEEQSAKVASLVGDIADQLRKMAAAGDSGTAKDLVAGVADQAQQMAQRLGDGGLDRTLADARRLARNRPGMFLAGAALAGFVAARVIRVADTDRLKEAATGASNANDALGNGSGYEPALDLTAGTAYPSTTYPATPSSSSIPSAGSSTAYQGSGGQR